MSKIKTMYEPKIRSLGTVSWGSLLRSAARSYPDKECLYDGPSEKRITYGEFYRQSNRMTNALLDIGLQKEDIISWLSSDRYWVFELFGVARAGFLLCSVNTRMIPEDIVTQTRHSDSNTFVFSEEFLEIAKKVRPQLPNVKHWIMITEKAKAPDGWLDMNELMSKASDSDPEDRSPSGPDDLCLLQYTSGTTGLPKGVLQTQASAYGMGYFGFAPPLGWNTGQTFMWQLPTFHAAGAVVAFAGCMLSGTRVIIPGQMEGSIFWKLVEKERVNSFLMNAAIWAQLVVRYPDWPTVKEQRDFSSVKTIMNVSSAIAPAVAEEIRSTFPGVALCEAYQSSETIFTYSTEDVMNTPPISVGYPFLGAEISIRDVADRTKELPLGQKGVIFARTPYGIVGYYKSDEENKNCLLPGGWFTAEDAGYIDPQTHRLILVDRVKDIVNTGGETVSSINVEAAVLKHPAVAECAVIGTEDRYFGEIVTAVVAFKPGMEATSEEIIEFCKDKLASHARPRRVELIDAAELPRSSLGKVKKNELRKKYEAKYKSTS